MPFLNGGEYRGLITYSVSDIALSKAPPSPLFFRCYEMLKSHEASNYEPHTHDCFEIIVPQTGHYECELNGGKISLAPGGLLFVQYGDRHQDCYQQESSFAVLQIECSDNALRRPFSAKTQPEARISPFRSSLATIFKEIGAESGSGAISLGVMEGLCQAFFWKFIKGCPKEALSRDFQDAVSKLSERDELFAIFRRSFGDALDIDAVCKRLGVSRRKLHNLCKQHFGASPSNAFMTFKMKEAAKNLAEEGPKIHELAARFGFKDQFHFSRAFKRCLGAAPSAFLRKES